jgi:hypothetical protein
MRSLAMILLLAGIAPLAAMPRPAASAALADTAATWTFESNVSGDSLGYAISPAGDVNGDGFSDIAASARSGVHVFYGSAAGPFVNAPWIESAFGSRSAPAGDVNGDGIDDLLSFETSTTGTPGMIALFAGSASGLGSSPLSTITGPADSSRWANQVIGVGDVDGDGYDDVLVSAPGDGRGTIRGAVMLYRGGPGGLLPGPAWTYSASAPLHELGVEICGAGDMNGDGYADVAILARIPFAGSFQDSTARILFFAGSPSGLPSVPTWVYDGDAWHIAGPGDFNGDGYSDIAFAYGYDNNATTYVLAGSPAGPSMGYTASGEQVSVAGDVNGDGYADLITRYCRVQCLCGLPQCKVDCGLGGCGYATRGGGAQKFVGGVGPGFPQPWFLVQPIGVGDVNGDGFDDILAAHPVYSNGQVHEGVIQVRAGGGGASTNNFPTLTNSTVGDEMGSAVAAIGDLNGDGYPDLAVGSPGATRDFPGEGRVDVYLGSATGFPAVANLSVMGGVAGAHLGASLAGGGDLNGDGFSDLVMGAPDYQGAHTGEGAVMVLYGSATPDSVVGWKITGGQAGAHLGISVAIAGDVDGDGFSDLLAGAPAYTNLNAGEGRVMLFAGSSVGLGTSPAWTHDGGAPGMGLGATVATAGDVNRDGWSDVAIGIPGSSEVEIFFGSGTGLAQSPSQTLAGSPGSEFGTALAAGDVNDDGFSDLVVGSPNSGIFSPIGQADAFLGSTSGLSTTSAWTVTGALGSGCGSSVAVGDFDADGCADVVVGSPTDGSSGTIAAYHGSLAGLSTTAFLSYGGTGTATRYGTSLAVLDANSDGCSEVAIGDPGQDYLRSGGWVWFAGSSNIPDRPRLTRQFRPGSTVPVDLLGSTGATAFLMRQRGFSAYGRARLRLEWQVKPLGSAWGPIQHAAWYDTGSPVGPTGSMIPLQQLASGLLASTPHALRARVASPTSVYYPHSPWFTPLNNTPELTELRTGTRALAVGPGEPRGSGRLIVDVRPNPARGQVTVRLAPAHDTNATLEVIDVSGRRVRRLFLGVLRAGTREIAWDTRDDGGRTLSPGLYFLRARSQTGSDERSVMLLR